MILDFSSACQKARTKIKGAPFGMRWLFSLFVGANRKSGGGSPRTLLLPRC